MLKERLLNITREALTGLRDAGHLSQSDVKELSESLHARIETNNEVVRKVVQNVASTNVTVKPTILFEGVKTDKQRE